MQPNQPPPNYWQPSDDETPVANAPEQTAQERPLPEVGEAPQAEDDNIAPISWQASEYIHHEKQTAWFVGLTVISLLLVALSVFLQAWTFTALVVVMAISVGYMAMRPPRIMQYQLTAQGVQIDEKYFHYDDFRSFGIINEGPLYSVVLTPNKRFMPSVTMYFPQELGEKIVDLLGAMLPMEEIRLDPVDKFVRKLRF